MRQWIVVAFIALNIAACSGDDDDPAAETPDTTQTMCVVRAEPDVILTPGGPTLTPQPTQLVPCPTPFFSSLTPSATEAP